MKIVQLSAENVKGIVAVQITPAGEPIVLTGVNGAGKSSVLESIFFALTNNGLTDPIRHGENKAVVRLHLGEVVVERRVTPNGNYLDIRSTANGLKVSSPQALLDSLVGDLTLDPIAFSKLKPGDQRATLLKAAGVSTEEIDARYRKAYDDRTGANRVLKDAMAVLDKTPDAPEGTLDVEIVRTDLTQQHSGLLAAQVATAKAKSDLDGQRTVCRNRAQESKRRLGTVLELESKLAQARAELATAIRDEIGERGFADALEEGLPTAPDASLIDALNAQIRAVEATNQAVRTKAAKSKARKTVEDATAAVQSVESTLSAIAAEKAGLLAAANLGIPGLQVTDNGVTVDGVVFSQRSTAEQIETSTLLAMKLNPKLKIIMIREGSSLDKKTWGRVCALAKEHDYQVWVERVQDEAGPVGLHISEGQIVAVDGVKVESAA
jgi:hypothetical protein